MNLRNLPGINHAAHNISTFSMPFGWLGSFQKLGTENQKKMVVYFGNDMAGILDLGAVDREQLITRSNQCLDYIRKHYEGYEFYYKPHPADPNEYNILNASDFKFINDKTTAELFLWQNRERIKAVFGITSLSTFNAYNLGLDAHAMYLCFTDIYPRNHKWIFDDMYFDMPESFFIRSLDQEVVPNDRVLESDYALESKFRELLSKHSGKIWLGCSFSESVLFLIAISKLVRHIDPNRKIGLIINRHHRWNVINLDYFKDYFDDISLITRVSYTLNPRKLWKVFKTMVQIKKFPVAPNDVLMFVSQPEFVENCFLSYHKKSIRIGLITSRDLNGQYNSHNLVYTNHDDFRFNKATWFFNHILEPILGLNRTIYMAFTKWKGFYQGRYQKPINEVFDQLYVFSQN